MSTCAEKSLFPVSFQSRYRDENTYSVAVRRLGRTIRVVQFDNGDFKDIYDEVTESEKQTAVASVLQFQKDEALRNIEWFSSRNMEVPAEVYAAAGLAS